MFILDAVQSIKLDLLQHDTDVPILESTSEMANGSTSKLPVGKYSVCYYVEVRSSRSL